MFLDPYPLFIVFTYTLAHIQLNICYVIALIYNETAATSHHENYPS